MRELYPALEPSHVHAVAVEEPHVLHVEEAGDPHGLPVVFLHGGPGSGCRPYHRQFFDPGRYRIVVFDQRGAGRSRPAGCTESNDTQRLIADMEHIRQALGIDRWLVFGGSWGATLGLLYAQMHPERVLGLILRGTFLASPRDLDWFFKDGVRHIFPDAWEELVAPISLPERADLIGAYHRRVNSEHRRERLEAARAWAQWTGRVVTYTLPGGSSGATQDEEALLRDAKIELHYALHRYFIQPDQILDDVDRLPAVPVTIVHGRRDLTCTLEAGWRLHRALPAANLVIVPEAGHLASEPAMIDALVTETDRMAGVLGG